MSKIPLACSHPSVGADECSRGPREVMSQKGTWSCAMKMGDNRGRQARESLGADAGTEQGKSSGRKWSASRHVCRDHGEDLWMVQL